MFHDNGFCPYAGLRPFTEGRDEHIDQATRHLERNKFIIMTDAMACVPGRPLPCDPSLQELTMRSSLLNVAAMVKKVEHPSEPGPLWMK